MKFAGQFINPSSSLMYCGILVPSNIMEQIKELDNKRFIITVNQQISFPGTPVSVEKDKFIILVNKERAKKLRIQFGDSVEVFLTQDESKYGMPLPHEFAEALFNDPEAEALFEKLTPGKIRSLIYLVAKLKNEDKRIEKSVIILEHLRINHGKLDFKILNQAFKDYNKLS